MNIAWWLERAADEYGDKVALIDTRRGTTWTYRELRRHSEAVAAVLRRDLGIGPDDVIATLMPDDCWHSAVFFGLQRLGAIFSGFNRMLGFEKFSADATRLEAKVIIVGRDYVELGKRLVAETCIERYVICDETAKPTADRSGLVERALDPALAIGNLRIAPRVAEDVAAVNFTGGTSGVSKGVIFPHGRLALSAQGSLFYDRLVSTDRNISCISLYHSGGIHDALKWVMAGATNILLGGWEAAHAAAVIEKHRPTWIYFWVSTMARDLMRQPSWAELPLEGVNTIVSGEAVPAELQEALIKRGLRMSNSYGMSETMPVGILKPVVAYGDDPPYGSCGKPMPELCEVVLKDPATGKRITEPGITGEVCVRGGVVSPGYYNDPERTAAALDEEGFLHTRDVAKIDAGGWWFLGGRTDDIINSGGEKLSLNEVEDVLRRHPLIVEVACTVVAHERFGEVPAAVVVTGPDGPSEAELTPLLDAHCLEQMERWKRPRLYLRIDAIPRTMPKRTKDLAALKRLVAGITLRESDGVVGKGQLAVKKD